MINKKGQLGQVAYILIVIFVTPFILVWFSSVIDGSADVAQESIAEDSIVGRFVLIAFQPLLWIFYFILSIIILAAVIFRGAS